MIEKANIGVIFVQSHPHADPDIALLKGNIMEVEISNFVQKLFSDPKTIR